MKNFPTIIASAKKALPKAISYAIEAFFIGSGVISIADYLHDRGVMRWIDAAKKVQNNISSEDVTE